jgi:hypothetical protein
VAAADLRSERAGVLFEQLFHLRLRNYQSVGMGKIQRPQVEREHTEIEKRRNGSAGAELLQQSAMVQNLDRPRVKPQGFGKPGGLGKPFEHDGINARQPQFGRQHQPDRTASGYDYVVHPL